MSDGNVTPDRVAGDEAIRLLASIECIDTDAAPMRDVLSLDEAVLLSEALDELGYAIVKVAT